MEKKESAGGKRERSNKEGWMRVAGTIGKIWKVEQENEKRERKRSKND